MQKNTTKKSGIGSVLGGLVRNQIFIPIAALLLLVLFNLIVDPTFFNISVDVNSDGYRILSGPIVTVLNFGSDDPCHWYDACHCGQWRTGYQCGRHDCNCR